MPRAVEKHPDHPPDPRGTSSFILTLFGAAGTLHGLSEEGRWLLWPSLAVIAVALVSRWCNVERLSRQRPDPGDVGPRESPEVLGRLLHRTRLQVGFLLPFFVVAVGFGLGHSWATRISVPVMFVSGVFLCILEFRIARSPSPAGTKWLGLGRAGKVVVPGTTAALVVSWLVGAAVFLTAAMGLQVGTDDAAKRPRRPKPPGGKPTATPRPTPGPPPVDPDPNAPGLGPLSDLGAEEQDGGEGDAPPGTDCAPDIYEVVADIEDLAVRDGMTGAYEYYWNDQIGCPSGRIKEKDGLYVLWLLGGGSGRAVIVSDSLGNANVALDEVLGRVRHFVQEGLLDRLGFRTTTGLGQFQVAYLRDSTCAYSERREYGSAYIHLGRAASALVIGEATRLPMFPSLLEEEGRRVQVQFRGPDPGDDKIRTLVSRGGEAWWVDDPQVRTTRDTPCGDVELLDSLAEQQVERLKKWLSQQAATPAP